MDNRDILEFPFVDRTEEQVRMLSFLKSNSYSNTIWVSGARGAGKTSFIEHCIANSEWSEPIWVHASIPSCHKTYIASLVKALQDVSDRDITDFIRENYSSLFDVIKNVAIGTLKAIGIDIEHLIEALSDTGKIVMKQANNLPSVPRIISNYLRCAIKSERYPVVILDDFSHCDSVSMTTILQVISECLDYQEIKFIIVTEDDSQGNDIEQNLLSLIPVENIRISFFNNPLYFYEIFMYRFCMTDYLKNNIKRVFEYCHGSPEQLRSLLARAWREQGIYINTDLDQAVINEPIVEDLLKKSFKLSFDQNLSMVERMIIFILVSTSRPLSISTVNEMVTYVGHKLFNVDLTIECSNNLFGLMDRNIVTCSPITFVENEMYVSFQSQLRNWSPAFIISHHLLAYVQEKKSSLKKDGWYEDDISLLIARLSYQAQTEDWLDLNLSLCRYFYEKESYQTTINLWARILNYATVQLSVDDLLLATECYFYVGEYNNAVETLKRIYLRDDDIARKYKYCLLSALLGNITLNKESALAWSIELQKFSLNDDQMIYAKTLQQQILVDLYQDKVAAKHIFDAVVKRHELEHTNSIFICRMLRSSTIYYNGQAARELLSHGIRIAREQGNMLEEAYLLNNFGFCLINESMFAEAEKVYADACKIICEIRYHEASYCFSNIAVCLMLKHEYNEAITCITKAMLCNKSDYVDITLKLSLAICYTMVGKIKMAITILDQLFARIDNLHDNLPTIRRKVYNNAAVIYIANNDYVMARIYADKARQYSRGTSSEFRNTYYTYRCKNGTTGSEPFIYTYSSCSYRGFLDFDPWFLTITHD